MKSFQAFIKGYAALLAAILAALSSPLFTYFYRVSPPSPPAVDNLDVFTSMLCLVILLGTYIFGSSLQARLRKRFLIISLLGLVLSLSLYFYVYKKVVIQYPPPRLINEKAANSPDNDRSRRVNRLIIGTDCTEEAKMVLREKCSSQEMLTRVDVLDLFAASGLPDSLWSTPGIKTNSNRLVFLWFAIFANFTIATGILATYFKGDQP
jgi:hypothetical protein